MEPAEVPANAKVLGCPSAAQVKQTVAKGSVEESRTVALQNAVAGALPALIYYDPD